MVKISKRLAFIPASPIRKLAPLALEAEKKGVKVYRLNIGDPDIRTPQPMLEVLRNWKLDPIRYGQSQGEPALIEAMKWYYHKLGFNFIEEENIQITTGGSEAISMALFATCGKGDEVLVFEPFYTNYNSFAAINDVKLIPILTDIKDGFHLPNKKVIEKHISPKTKAILICNPNNPTGTVYTRDEIEMLIDIAKKHDLFLLSDEVYREFVFDGGKQISLMNYMTDTNRLPRGVPYGNPPRNDSLDCHGASSAPRNDKLRNDKLRNDKLRNDSLDCHGASSAPRNDKLRNDNPRNDDGLSLRGVPTTGSWTTWQSAAAGHGNPAVHDNIIVLDSLSKRYGLCGARVGCLVSLNKEIMAGVSRIAQGRLSCGLVDQIMAAKLVQVPDEYIKQVQSEYQARRDLVYRELKKIPGVTVPHPEGAFYMIVKLPVDDAEKFCKWLLTDYWKISSAESQAHSGGLPQTVMLAPAGGFYSMLTPDRKKDRAVKGRNEVRIAYVLNQKDLKRSVEILKRALTTYSSELTGKLKFSK